MAVGTGGRGRGSQLPPPPIFCQPKTYKSVYSNAHSSVDVGNQRYTNVQNCILLKCKCDNTPQSQNVPTALVPCTRGDIPTTILSNKQLHPNLDDKEILDVTYTRGMKRYSV